MVVTHGMDDVVGLSSKRQAIHPILSAPTSFCPYLFACYGTSNAHRVFCTIQSKRTCTHRTFFYQFMKRRSVCVCSLDACMSIRGVPFMFAGRASGVHGRPQGVVVTHGTWKRPISWIRTCIAPSRALRFIIVKIFCSDSRFA